jgi:hypothetical protein
MPWNRDDQGNPCPYIFKLSPGARQAWEDFASAIEHELGEGGRLEFIRDWGGKLPGLAGRLAGLFQAMECLIHAPNQDISKDIMNRALELTSGLIGHALAAFNMMGTDLDIEAAKRVLTWISRDSSASFSVRECYRALRGRYPKVEQIKNTLNTLVERGYIFPQKVEHKGPGRSPSLSYRVNPKIMAV